MRTLFLGVLCILATGAALAQSSIRQVDFKNFSYPLSSQLLGHGQLQWLDISANGPIKSQSVYLTNGKDANNGPGFTLQSVDYGDVNGDGKEEAIVVLRYGPESAPIARYIYFYSLAAGSPKLLAYCHSGDHGYSALDKIYVDSGQLVIELVDTARLPGACCMTKLERRRFRWQDGRFQSAGASEFFTRKQQ